MKKQDSSNATTSSFNPDTMASKTRKESAKSDRQSRQTLAKFYNGTSATEKTALLTPRSLPP